jgi:hypothetical protein
MSWHSVQIFVKITVENLDTWDILSNFVECIIWKGTWWPHKYFCVLVTCDKHVELDMQNFVWWLTSNTTTGLSELLYNV